MRTKLEEVLKTYRQTKNGLPYFYTILLVTSSFVKNKNVKECINLIKMVMSSNNFVKYLKALCDITVYLVLIQEYGCKTIIAYDINM